jgi:hypothetical protein
MLISDSLLDSMSFFWSAEIHRQGTRVDARITWYVVTVAGGRRRSGRAAGRHRTHVAGGGALKLDAYFQLPAATYHISARPLSSSTVRLGLSSGQLGVVRPRVSFML